MDSPTKYLVLGLAVVLILAGAAQLWGPNGNNNGGNNTTLNSTSNMSTRDNSSITLEEFKEIVGEKEYANIVMNLTDTNQAEALNVMNCGVSLAYSLAAINKNITNFVVNGSVCYATNATLSLGECGLEQESAVTFYVQRGNDRTLFYKNKAIVEVSSNYSEGCFFGKKWEEPGE